MSVRADSHVDHSLLYTKAEDFLFFFDGCTLTLAVMLLLELPCFIMLKFNCKLGFYALLCTFQTNIFFTSSNVDTALAYPSAPSMCAGTHLWLRLLS